MKKNILWGVLVCVLIVSAGCGYTARSALPERFKTVYVEPFANEIDYDNATGARNVYFPLLEVDVHDALVERFQFDGNLHMADTAQEADLVLKGTIKEYRRDALRLDDNNDVQEYRVQIVVKLNMIDTSLDEEMWAYNRFIGEATYFVTGSLATSEETAVSDAAQDLAKRIVERTIEDW